LPRPSDRYGAFVVGLRRIEVEVEKRGLVDELAGGQRWSAVLEAELAELLLDGSWSSRERARNSFHPDRSPVE